MRRRTGRPGDGEGRGSPPRRCRDLEGAWPGPHRWRSFKLSNDPAFAEKLHDVVGLYVAPPAHAVVLSVDEKSQIQALDRTQPGLPLKKGRGPTMTHDYKRNGTTTLFAALNVLTARSSGEHAAPPASGVHPLPQRPRARHPRRQGRPRDPRQLRRPQARQGPRLARTRHPRWTFHFTPTSSSWLNAVEGFFAKLSRRRLKHGVFHSVVDLQAAINRFVAEHNERPSPSSGAPTPTPSSPPKPRVPNVGVNPLGGFWSDAGRRDAGGATRAQGLARDSAQVDGRGWALVVARTAPKVPPAAPATGMLWRARPDRRLRAPLVRGPRRSLHPARLHRRCDRHADGAAVRHIREHVQLLRRPGKLSGTAWPPGRLLQRQALGLSRPEAQPAHDWHDPVRAGAGRAEHRDSLREQQPGQRPCRTRQPHLARPAGEGTSPRRHFRHGGRQCVPARLHGALQREVRQNAGAAGQPASRAQHRTGSARRDLLPAGQTLCDQGSEPEV
jgi:hypothetical protein